MKKLELPAWLHEAVFGSKSCQTDEDFLSLSVDIATLSAQNSGGPFGAVLVDDENSIVSIGWNQVVTTFDSTAHAEVDCIRRAQQNFQSHDLGSNAIQKSVRLYSSAAPCIQCFGVIYWSGVQQVYAAASKEDAESAGFDEGPISEALWEKAKGSKGISYKPLSLRQKNIQEPFEVFKNLKGKLY